ncbi:MAG: hypothetical protein Q9170_003130 [Blastenia crenularia]
MSSSTSPDRVGGNSKEALEPSVSGPGGSGEPDKSLPAPSKFSSTLQEAAFIALVGLSQLFSVGGLGLSAFNVFQIGHTLDVSKNGDLSWFLSAYALCGGVFVLVTGRLGDHFGHKYVFMFGWIWMALWSLITGFADDVVLFDFSRAMMGVGSGFLVPNAFALLGRAFEPFSIKKNISFAFVGFCSPAGYIFGGLIGAAFAQKSNWRWSFWLWAICTLVLGAYSFLAIPHRIGSPIPGLSMRDFDYIGCITGVTGLTLFSFAWNQAPVVGWQKAYVYVLLIIGILFLIAFVFVQAKVKNPVLPNHLWKRKGFTPIMVAMCFGWMSFGIFLYYTTIWIFTIRMKGPLENLAEMTPLVIGGLFATASVGIFIMKVPAHFIFGVSMFSFFLGCLLMSFAKYSDSYWAFVGPACLLVVGGPDLSFASSNIIVSNAVLESEQGVAGSFISTVVLFSVAQGLGFAATVEGHVNHGGKTMPDLILGYRGAYWLGMGFAAIAFFTVAIFIRDDRLDGTKGHKDANDAQDTLANGNGAVGEAEKN